jgi:RimJ/RimL family protein N-acetyltransferase
MVYAPDQEPDGQALMAEIRALRDSTTFRTLISRRGHAAVDGRGTLRVARAMDLRGVNVRQATPADSATLHAWRNDPAIRLMSRSQDPIDFATHERWLGGVLADANRDLLIGVHDGRDIGVVRFDVDGEEAEVSIYLAPDQAGAGLGVDLLAAAERWLVARRPVRALRAVVMAHNHASRRFFPTCGYVPDSLLYRKRVSA